ncbi:MAG TPA: SMC family ATPase [Candidatus Aquicultor sp.]
MNLTNFMSYKRMDEPLSFSSIHTAVLCGPNGHGKSSLLDAITWATWGRARGVDKRGTGTDDLIHHKEAHMQVEFTFDLEGQRYRVIRSRSRKGKTGQSRLEFQVFDNGVPRSLTGETINATQDAINRALRMDYETFVNSAFVVQGRADTFMTKSANERKEILSEILGLSIYDELEELAREKRKGQNDSVKDIDNRIAFIDQELDQLPAYKQELEVVSAELSGIQSDIASCETALTQLHGKKAVFGLKSSQLSGLKEENARIELDVKTLDMQLIALNESVRKAQSLIEREGEISAGYDELVGLRAREEKLASAGQQYGALEAKANLVKTALATIKSTLDAELKHLTSRKTALEKECAQKAMLEAELAANKAGLAQFAQIERELEEKRAAYTELQQKKAAAEATAQALAAHYAEEAQRRSLFSDGDSCPLCKKPLDQKERTALAADMSQAAAKIANEREAAQREIERITRDLEALKAAGTALSEKARGKSGLQVKEGRLVEKLQALEKAAQEISAINNKLTELNLQITQQAYAQAEHSELQRLGLEMRATGYSVDAHNKVKVRLKELLIYESLRANLENAKTAMQMTQVTIGTLSSQKESKLTTIAVSAQKIVSLEQDIAALAGIVREIEQREAELADTKKLEAAVLQKCSAIQAKIDTCTALTKRKKDLVKTRKAAAKEAEIYDRLAFAFSKKGIQALIIENTIPEIEEEANELLHRLTDGQMSLRFVTQKDQRTGGVIETLDLIITDGELGERKYELFSGGEAFRINFAVRIALSKLLSRRSGARLETLVVDEGFGTQDEEGKERLIEAISAIQDDFKKIIIVTHLDDLKELFPTRIEVVKKRGLGSVATIA